MTEACDIFWTILYFLVSEGVISGRGCSTQKPNFKRCDTHKYGAKKKEKFCYCTKDFCNSAPSPAVTLPLLLLLLKVASCFLTPASCLLARTL